VKLATAMFIKNSSSRSRCNHATRDRLTAREIQVATLVWQGLANKDIARVLLTSEQVVKNYLRTASTNFGVGPAWNWLSTWPPHGGPQLHVQLGNGMGPIGSVGLRRRRRASAFRGNTKNNDQRSSQAQLCREFMRWRLGIGPRRSASPSRPTSTSIRGGEGSSRRKRISHGCLAAVLPPPSSPVQRD